MFHLFRSSLRVSLSFQIAVVAVLAASLVGGLAQDAARDALLETTTAKLQALAQSRESHALTVIRLRWNELEILSRLGSVRAVLEGGGAAVAAAQRELAAAREHGDFAELGLAAPSGLILASSDPARVGRSVAAEPWFKRALERPSAGRMRKVDGGVAYPAAVPVRDDATGRTVGVMFGAPFAVALYRMLGEHEGLGRTGETYLVDPAGLLLSPSRFVPNAELSLRNSGGALAQLTAGKDGGGAWLDYRNAPVLGYVMFEELQQETGVDWALVQEVDEEEALAPVAALRRRVLVISATIVVLAIAFGYLLSRSLTRPVISLAGFSSRIAGGDLSSAAGGADTGAAGRSDELGALASSFSQMGSSLREVLGRLQAGAGDLSARSNQVGATARQYATSAAEQATSVAEISTTIEEIKRTTEAAAQGARDVVEEAERATQSGQRGLEAVTEAVGAMQAIGERVDGIATKIVHLSEQTAQIGEIVETVGDLAEQSNLLAVNASIEAAKAGEHGRGFAVVAAEVRSLAEQSKRAAQQIRALLQQIQKATDSAVIATEEGTRRAGEGRRAVDSVRVVIEELATALESSSDRARQIAGASSQQVLGVSQIAEAIATVSAASKDNLGGVRQLEEAAAGLADLARDLKAMAERYRL